MASDVERMQAACAVAGENVPPGAADEQLEAFEQRHGVGLPAGMRAFYTFMNGAVYDHAMFAFWPLDEIRRTTVDNESNWFIFADHSVSVFEYAIQLTIDGSAPNNVYCPELARKVATSFTDFLRRCRDESMSLL